jgi:phage protein D
MTKTFAELEDIHSNLYVPTFQLLVKGKDVVSDLFMEIASVQVDNTLKGADHFTFTVNSTFDLEKRQFAHLSDLFAFGSPVEIYMGYKGSKTKPELDMLLKGFVTSVSTSFPASGLPQITVGGFDLSYCMTKGKESRSWSDATDSTAVADVAKAYGLTAKVEDTRVKHPTIQKSTESDQQFLDKLAERNGYELYTFDQTLHFKPPESIRKTTESGQPIVTLEWGRGLLSFTPEINISEQVTSVEVRGWDVANRSPIVGTAGQGKEPRRDGARRSGGEALQTCCREQEAPLKIRVPVFSQQEADLWAAAILKKRSEMFVQGSGESIGLPELRADTNIELLGLGRELSKTYYVEQTTHTINTSGYRTTFRVKDTTI